MEQRTRKSFSKEYKEEAVKLIKSGRFTIQQAATELNVDSKNIRRWMDETEKLKKNSEEHQNGCSKDCKSKALEKRNRQLEQEKDILKKAAAFFAKESM